ncbi:DNA-binding response regulator, partial [Stenotrophomonas geniculata]
MKSDARTRLAPLVLIAEDEGEIADILGAYLARSGLRSA